MPSASGTLDDSQAYDSELDAWVEFAGPSSCLVIFLRSRQEWLASQTLVRSYFWRLLIGTIIRLAASFLGEAVIMSTWTCFAVGFQLFTLSSAQLVWNCGRLATVYQALKESALQIDLTTRRQTAVGVVTRQETSCIALLFMCHFSTVERCHFSHAFNPLLDRLKNC